MDADSRRCIPPLPLAGIHVLEVAQGVSGPFCGKILAEFGAEVLKVEPPTGDTARRCGPFAHDDPHPERSLLFLYLNTAKRSITLQLDNRAGIRLIDALVKRVDVLITDPSSAALAAATPHPHLIHSSIRPFGMTGPHADWPASELTVEALAGLMAIVGDPDLAPVKVGGEQGHYLAGLNAAVGTLLALDARDRTGLGQVVDISMQESLLTILGNIPLMYSHLGVVTRRIGSRHHRTHPTAIFPCKDGHVGIAAQTHPQWEALCLLVDQPELLVDSRFTTGPQRAEHADALDALLLPWFMARTRHEVTQDCQARRIPVGFSSTIPELLEDPQFAATGFFTTIEHPAIGSVHYPGPAFRMEHTRSVHTRAPFLGEHNDVIYGGWLGLSRHECGRLRAQGVI